MQVEVLEILGSPDGVSLARIRTATDDATVRWCENWGASVGTHRVEWHVCEDLVWGVTAFPAPAPGPALRSDGDRVVFRGRFDRNEPAFGTVQVDGIHIMFDLAGDWPVNTDGTWIEVHADPAHVELYPISY
jgi:hypothetical protein